MKKVYVLAPLIGVLIFGVFYWQFAQGYQAQIDAKALALRKQRQEQQENEARLRKAAIEDALRLQEQRKKEKAERDAKDLKEKEDRQAAVDARDKAYREQDKLAKQVDRLNKEIEAEKKAISSIEDDKKRSVDEEAFLRQYVRAAEANVKGLEQVLTRIQAADKAAEDAAKAAAAAKKS